MSKYAWIPSLIIPGSGQAVEGRLARAVVLFVAAAVGVDLFLLGKFVFSGEGAQSLVQTGLIVFGLAWFVGLGEMFYHHHTFDPRRLEEELLAHLRKAVAYYLSGRYDEAESELKAMLRRSPDDVEAHLYLAGVYRHAGDRRRAVAEYRKVLALDDAGKWGWQVEREMRELESGEA